MKTNSRPLLGALTLALVLLNLAAITPCRAADQYRFLKEIPIGGEGGGDYLTTDEAARRLYVTHATKVVVIDLDKNEVVGEIADTPGIHGFAVAPELGRGFSSNGKENKASIVDLATLKTLSKVETGANPDAILYEPQHKEVYTFNGRANSATIFEAASGKVTATIALPGKPEFAVVDPKAGRIYVNIEDKHEVTVIDTQTHAVVAHWPIAPGEEPSGMAIDLAHHRLFVGCGNHLMPMLDSTSGKVLGSVPIGDHVDANRFDAGTGLAFASCGDGTVTIARADAEGKLTVVQTLKTAPGAKTMTLDAKTHRIYLSASKAEAGSDNAKAKRPKMLPGSFRVLVYEMEK
ncbi:MAG: YncE family protein [Verrucomicrobia bacterium]|nr:YncE family protein [Verrucomicrobiota bacterium]